MTSIEPPTSSMRAATCRYLEGGAWKLFEILEKEDDYVRASDIRGQFSKS